MRRFVVTAAAFVLPLLMLEPAHGCNRHAADPCQGRNELGQLGAAILGGNASGPLIPGTTWGLSRSGQIVPVPIAPRCARHRRCWG